MEKIVRVLRVIEYVGPQSWVESQVAGSIQGERRFGPNNERIIRAATIGVYPEILENLPTVIGYPGQPHGEK